MSGIDAGYVSLSIVSQLAAATKWPEMEIGRRSKVAYRWAAQSIARIRRMTADLEHALAEEDKLNG